MKIKYIPKRDKNCHNPMIATFQQTILKNEQLEELEYSLLENQELPRKILKAESENMIYKSKSIPFNQQNCKYLLGVINSDEKEEIRLYEIDHIFSLNQQIKAHIGQQQNDSNILQSNLTPWEQKQDLVGELGTLKAKRKVQQAINNRVQEENISSKQAIQQIFQEKSEKIQDIIIEQNEDTKQDLLNEKKQFLPDFDTQTDDINKIYNIFSIISQDELESIKTEDLQNSMKKKAVKSEGMTQYIKNLLINYDQYFDNSGKQKQQILKYLIYLDYLIKFSNIPRFTKGSIEEVAQEMNIDILFTKNIIIKYYQATQSSEDKIVYVRSQLLRDKFVCHCVVLALFAFGFTMNVSNLALALKTDPKRMIMYCKEIGCSVSLKDTKDQENQTSINIHLKAPLKLQTVKNKYQK